MSTLMNKALRKGYATMLFDYQEDGVRWIVNREVGDSPRGGFLCDEMGLGKTIQLIEAMRRNSLNRTLVVFPKSIGAQWQAEIAARWDVPVWRFDGSDRTVPPDSFHGVVLAPYSVVSDLVGTQWDRVILDEGHEIRNPKSKTHKLLRSLEASVRWVVSGTPIFNSMRDFVALAGFLGVSAGTVAREYNRLRKELVLRRTKDEVGLNIPLKFENIELEMYPEEKSMYEAAFLAGKGVVRTVNVNAMLVLECLLRIRQVMIWPQLYIDGMCIKEGLDPEPYRGRSKKHETLMEMIRSHPDEKTLVFTHFMGETDRIQEMLIAEGIPTFRLDGQVDTHERMRRIEAFRKAPVNAVFLIQIRAGGVGLNLQEASRVYITSPAWNPATELQAIGRSHRTGQNKEVVVKKLVYKDISEDVPSVEESIVNLQIDKSRVCANVLNDNRILKQVPGVSNMKIRTIAKLFRARV